MAVLALLSALYFVQTREQALRDANNGIQPTPAVVTPVAPAGAPEPAPAQHKGGEKKPVGAKPAASTAKPVVSPGQPSPTFAAPAAVSPAKESCLYCGTVIAVTPVEREGSPSGAGAVAGGVLGALVGNQLGRGQGKDVATILGAIGGGVAGNVIEKKMKKETVYQVQVRMDDGSTRSLEQAQAVGVGQRVRLEGEILQPLTPAD